MKRSSHRRRRRRPRLSACQFQGRRRPAGRCQLAPQRPLVSRPSTAARVGPSALYVRPYSRPYVRDQSRDDFVPTHLTIRLCAGSSRLGSAPAIRRSGLLIYDRPFRYQPFSGVHYLLASSAAFASCRL